MRLVIQIFILFFICFSCKKVDPPVQTAQKSTTTANQLLSLAGEWILRSGTIYFYNLETGQKTKYAHFGVGRTTSSLRFDGIEFNIEKIIQDTTSWSFYPPKTNGSYGVFVLNGDSAHAYGLNIMTDFWSIIENPTSTASTMQLGGSARPFSGQTTDYKNKTATFHIQDGTCSINGYNYEYFSELKFQKTKEW